MTPSVAIPTSEYAALQRLVGVLQVTLRARQVTNAHWRVLREALKAVLEGQDDGGQA